MSFMIFASSWSGALLGKVPVGLESLESLQLCILGRGLAEQG